MLHRKVNPLLVEYLTVVTGRSINVWNMIQPRTHSPAWRSTAE